MIATFHDSHPVHTAQAARHKDDEFGPLAFKREGDEIVVFPGGFHLTLSEWASVVAFTTPEGGNSETFEAALALVEGRVSGDENRRLRQAIAECRTALWALDEDERAIAS